MPTKIKMIEFVGGGPQDGRQVQASVLKDQTTISFPVKYSSDPVAQHIYERISDNFFIYKGIK